MWPKVVILGVAIVVSIAARTPQSTEHTYLLPFPAGDSARLIQGPNGPYGHTGHAEWAWDFVMPVGSPVTAAKPGVVVTVEERFADFTRKAGEENFVIVSHDDSTFARYYHLTINGALVDVGEKVAAGDTIARSGSTGASAGPHLHFDVTRGCYRWGCQSIRIGFSNASSDSLVAGRTYVAAPPGRS